MVQQVIKSSITRMVKHQLLKIIDNYLVMHSNIFLVREAKSSVVGMMRLVLKTRTTTKRVKSGFLTQWYHLV